MLVIPPPASASKSPAVPAGLEQDLGAGRSDAALAAALLAADSSSPLALPSLKSSPLMPARGRSGKGQGAEEELEGAGEEQEEEQERDRSPSDGRGRA
eukprot:765104-Hanusia_phi.AAC.2